MTDPFQVAFVGALTGGCLGGLMSFAVQRWRYNIDRWTAITDELCKEVVSVADMSSEFWLQARNATNKDAMALRELRIKGHLARVEALKSPFEDWCPRGAAIKFMNAHGELVDAVSGGSFTAPKRSADYQAAFRVQQAAAEVVGVVRYSLREGVGISAALDRVSRKS